MECKSRSCDMQCHGGTCTFVEGQQRCTCPQEYDGDNCEHYRCSRYCQNKGICHVVDEQDLTPKELAALHESLGTHQLPLRCQCSVQFTGDRCEFPISICKVSVLNFKILFVERLSLNSCGLSGSFSQYEK